MTQKTKTYVSDCPKLIADWDWDKNNELGYFPDKITHGSGLPVFWKCQKCGYVWQAKVNNRFNGRGCPLCANRIVVRGVNDLATTHPEIAKEWDFEKNGDLTPYDVSFGCNKKVAWICPKGHKYMATIAHRGTATGTNCPICNSGRQTSFAEQAILFYIKKYHPDAISRYKDIFDNGMELDIYIPSIHTAIEYDGIYWHSKSKKKDIVKVREKTKYEICRKNNIRLIRIKEGGKEQMTPLDIDADATYFVPNSEDRAEFSKFIMGFLSSLEGVYRPLIWYDLDVDVERDKNEIRKYMQEIAKKSIEDTHPNVAKEWDYEKNGDLKPSMFLAGSTERVWWRCSVCGYEWQTTIYARTKGSRCRQCYEKENRGANHPEARAMYQYSLDGDFIKKWDCINDIKKELGINVGNVGMCAKHQRPNAGGYRWEYELFDKLPPIVKVKKPRIVKGKAIMQLNANGEVINEFISVNEAGRQTGIDATSISRAANGHMRSAGGYFWKAKN